MTDELVGDRITGLTRRLASAVGIVQSPFTGQVQAHDWGGRWWEWEVDFAITQGEDGRKLDALINKQGSASSVMLFRDPSAARPEVAEAPLMNGATGTVGQSTLTTDGWTASTSTPPRMGDFLSAGTQADTRLYQIVSTPTASGTTGWNFDVAPSLRAAIADNAPLNVVNPGCAVRVINPPSARILAAQRYRFSLTLVEAL